MSDDHRPDCTGRHCCVCGDCTDQPQTCLVCVGRTRANVAAIVTEYARLPAETTDRGGSSLDPIPRGSRETAIPGGDALVMLAGGGSVYVQHRTPGPHWADENPTDPPSILNLLATWEDDWRITMGLPAAGKATIASCATFLGDWNAKMAQEHGAYYEYAAAIRQARSRLETYLRDDDTPEKGARCLVCDVRLIRRWRAPKPCTHEARVHPRQGETIDGYRLRVAEHEAAHMRCDQGGLADDWTCPRCKRRYADGGDSDRLAKAQEAMLKARGA